MRQLWFACLGMAMVIGLLGSCGHSTAPAAIQQPLGFSLAVDPATYTSTDSQGRFALTCSEESGDVVVEVAVEQARALKAAYLELRYDAARYAPGDVEFGGALKRGGQELLTLAVNAGPGVLCLGQVQAHCDQAAGFSGDGVVARVHFSPGQAPATRRASAPPVNPSSAPLLEFNAARCELSFYYTNTGDYDQNGLVNLSDMTPLAQHFGQAVTPAQLDQPVAVIDGDANGLINLADITPIAQNFRVNVSRGWRLYRSIDAADYPHGARDGNGAAAVGKIFDLDECDAGLSTAANRLHYSVVVQHPAAGDRFWVRGRDSGGAEGIASNEIVLSTFNQLPTVVFEITPDLALPASYIVFQDGGSADPDGGAIVSQEYDLNYDGLYETTSDPPGGPLPAISRFFSTAGEYKARLRVTDDEGGRATAEASFSVGFGDLDVRLVDLVFGSSSSKLPVLVQLSGSVPGLAYLRQETDSLVFIGANDSAGTDWRDPVTVDSNAISGFDLAILGGCPALSYAVQSGTDQVVRFRRAIDPNGVAWNDPLDLATLPDNTYPSPDLISVANNPLLVYRDYAYDYGGNLHRLFSANGGANWGGHISIDNDNSPISSYMLESIAGMPVLCWIYSPGPHNYEINLQRALDAQGASWAAAVPLNDTAADYGAVALFELQEHAALVYQDFNSDTYYLSRAVDAEFSGFTNRVPVLQDGGNAVNSWDIAEVHGIPFFAYTTDAGLDYSYALDINGYAWSSPLRIDSNDCSHPSVAEINGHPGIAYQRADSLMYATWQFP